jgi:hypothetical protein
MTLLAVAAAGEAEAQVLRGDDRFGQPQTEDPFQRSRPGEFGTDRTADPRAQRTGRAQDARPQGEGGLQERTDTWETGGGETAGEIGTEIQTGRDVSEALGPAIERNEPALESSQSIDAEEEVRLRDEPFSFDDDTGAARARAGLRGTEEFEPLGIRAGAFVLRPSIEVRGGILSEDDPDRDTKFVRVQPELSLESNWVRHALEGRIGWREQRFPDESALDETRIDGDLRLRLDVSNQTQVNAGVSFSRDETGNTDTEAPQNAVGDTETNALETTLSIQHQFGRVVGALRGALTRNTFDDTPLEGGGTADSSVRDFDETELGLRLDYAATDRSGVFADVSVNHRDFDAGVNADARALGSDGMRVLAGVTFDNQATLRGELGAGFQIQNPDDAALETERAFVLEGSALWSPTPLTSISLEANTTLDDSTTTGEGPDASYNFRTGIAHALRRNFILEGGGRLWI